MTLCLQPMPKVVTEVAIWPYEGGEMNLRFGQETYILLSSWLLAMVRHLTSHCLNCKIGMMVSDPFIKRCEEEENSNLSEENTISLSHNSHMFFSFKLPLRLNRFLKMTCKWLHINSITFAWFGFRSL